MENWIKNPQVFFSVLGVDEAKSHQIEGKSQLKPEQTQTGIRVLLLTVIISPMGTLSLFD